MAYGHILYPLILTFAFFTLYFAFIKLPYSIFTRISMSQDLPAPSDSRQSGITIEL